MKRGTILNLLLPIFFLAFNYVASAGDVVAQVQTQPVSQHDLVETLTGYGMVSINPSGVVNINFPRAGQVMRLLVTQGQVVKRGMPILQFDTSPMDSVSYAQALSEVSFARSELKRVQGLVEQQLATQSQLAKAQKALSDAEAALAAQQKLGTGIKYELIKAPFDGIVSVLNVAPGQRIQAGTAALQLARLNTLRVLLGIEPEDINKVKVGMSALLTPVFNTEESIRWVVSEVHGMINPQTQLVDVAVSLKAKQSAHLIPAMHVRGMIILNHKKGFAVPRQAVLRDAQGAYIFVVRHGRACRVNVQTGIESNGFIGIAGPFKKDDMVVVLGNYELQDGMAVQEAK